MPPFDELLTLRTIAQGRYLAQVPDGWQQGRGAFGGLVVALLVRAVSTANAEASRPLRTVSAELCGPVEPGDAELSVEPLRIGSGMSTLAVRLVQGGEVRAHAVAIFGRTRDPRISWQAARTLPSWSDASVLPIGPPLGPVFAQHFEFRPTGPLPFGGGPAALASGWIRPRDPGTARDAAFVAACADAYWPALYARMSAPRPMATIAYTLELLAPLDGLPVDAPLFVDIVAPAATDGYVVEDRSLYGVDGRLVALNRQTFVVIR